MMKKSIIILLAVLFVAIFAFGGCSKTDDPSIESPAADVNSSISEEEALAVVLDDLCIQETAAENLVASTNEVDGKKVYVFTFVWSGFDYQYTIDASTGEIVEVMFDGAVL